MFSPAKLQQFMHIRKTKQKKIVSICICAKKIVPLHSNYGI